VLADFCSPVSYAQFMVRVVASISSLTFSLVLFVHAPAAFPADNSGAVDYRARDHVLSGPDSIPAGWTTVQLTNQGKDLHQLQFIKLPPGKTVADFAAAISANHTRMPSWAERRGGPNGIMPGASATAVIYLDPGNYVAICGIPDRRGIPHVALGMLKAVTVTAGGTVLAISPDSTVKLVDFTFELSSPIEAGQRTIRVVNRGTQAHELVVVRLPPGATVRDFITAFRPGDPDTTQGTPMGGMVGLEPGGEGYVTLDFLPGYYGFICFLPDFIQGSPHFARGMLMDLSVK
jgi:hypothetical protein